MIVHNEPLFGFIIGDKRTSFARTAFYHLADNQTLLAQDPFIEPAKRLHLQSLVVLDQIHSSLGSLITQHTDIFAPYSKQGDFLITNLPDIGLGVASADCLPIIFYDTANHCSAIAHAGWLGSVQHVAAKTLETMQQQFATDLNYLKIFFGPSAKVCCYKVTSEFLDNFKHFVYAEKVFQHRSDGIYFDLPLFNKLQLEEIGVKKASFHLNYNICTICNSAYCSHRRDGTASLRQMTIVALK